MTLLPGDFAAFYTAVHGPTRDPFPWQTKLAQRVAAGEPWPPWLVLPTASGKTSCIDIAVFALAVQADRDPTQRTAARRMFFVVDRRVVVDDAYERGRHLASVLTHARTGVLRLVADRLRGLAGGPTPLAAFELRGGIYRDEGWTRSLLQPVVVASTVDQVGSRLLFRGYGLRSGYARPMHAALTSHDALIILDEAHCSEPFRQTLEAVAQFRAVSHPINAPGFSFSVMTATPPAGAAGEVLGLDEEDRDHPILSLRLRASKPAKLVEGPRGKGHAGDAQFAAFLAKEARVISSAHPRAVAVIVNRVATARRVRDELSRTAPERVILLTGRMRPIDRDEVVRRLDPLRTGRRQETLASSLYVVATQTLEVGADLDFDALVTECASLDALRQRFGRLNRLGRPIEVEARIVVRGDQVNATADGDESDPVYGGALGRTWQWLCAKANDGVIDMGIDAFSSRVGEPPGNLQPQPPDAPILLPAYVDCWAQTSPAPTPDPDVAVFLHGAARGAPEVYVCWRADLTANGRPLSLSEAIEAIGLCPPTVREAMPVPFWLARDWLRARADPLGLSDLESAAEPPQGRDTREAEARAMRWAVIWRGPEQSVVITATDEGLLTPEDTIVVPIDLGGQDVLGHVPSTAPMDVAEQCHVALRLRPVLRLTPALVQSWGVPDLDEAFRRLLVEEGINVDIADDSLTAFLQRVADAEDLPRWRRVMAQALRDDRRRSIVRHSAGGFVVTGSRRVRGARRAELLRSLDQPVPDLPLSDDDDAASATVEVGLVEHLEGVTAVVRAYGQALGIDSTIAADLERAAALHDIGKADPRFQALLRQGQPLLAGLPLLAKSGGLPLSPRARRAARARSAYPDGARHELLSVRLIESAPDLVHDIGDSDLVLHLVASHHGRCRPFAPVVLDESPIRVAVTLGQHHFAVESTATDLERLDSGVAERFWRLTRRFGPWGLAWLESVLRMADHECSRAQQEEREVEMDEAAV
jgi:CRISPR-associated endonuclease/helicase Cas3